MRENEAAEMNTLIVNSDSELLNVEDDAH